jgi:hypothetical protein
MRFLEGAGDVAVLRRRSMRRERAQYIIPGTARSPFRTLLDLAIAVVFAAFGWSDGRYLELLQKLE